MSKHHLTGNSRRKVHVEGLQWQDIVARKAFSQSQGPFPVKAPPEKILVLCHRKVPQPWNLTRSRPLPPPLTPTPGPLSTVVGAQPRGAARRAGVAGGRWLKARPRAAARRPRPYPDPGPGPCLLSPNPPSSKGGGGTSGVHPPFLSCRATEPGAFIPGLPPSQSAPSGGLPGLARQGADVKAALRPAAPFAPAPPVLAQRRSGGQSDIGGGGRLLQDPLQIHADPDGIRKSGACPTRFLQHISPPTQGQVPPRDPSLLNAPQLVLVPQRVVHCFSLLGCQAVSGKGCWLGSQIDLSLGWLLTGVVVRGIAGAVGRVSH